MYKLNIMNTAKKDLYDIEYYLKEKLNNHEAFRNLFKKFLSKVKLLCLNPNMYSKYTNSTTGIEFRKLLVNNYIVFYTIDEDNNIINIARVIYNKRNYDMELTTTILQEETIEYTTK